MLASFAVVLSICSLAAAEVSIRVCLVDGNTPGYSSKLDELDRLLNDLLQEQDRKILMFSEWTGMLDLVEPLVHLDAAVDRIPKRRAQARCCSRMASFSRCLRLGRGQ